MDKKNKISTSYANDVIRGMFAERVSDPLEWFKHSRSLIAAARATVDRSEMLIDQFEKSDLLNVASLLYGFALENLFKAIWIYQKFGSSHDENWYPEDKFPKELKTHDLIELANLIDQKIVEEFNLALSLLTDATTWSGRYPCSVKGDEGTIGRWPQINEHAEIIYKRYSKQFTISS
jgi:hypothetical protein